MSKEKKKLIKKLISQIDKMDPYFTILKGLEQEKEAYSTIYFAEMKINEMRKLLSDLKEEYSKS